MKKLTSILLAIFFIASYNMSAQDVAAEDTKKATTEVVECESQKTKEVECKSQKTKSTCCTKKKSNGFNFNKSNSYGKSSSCSSASKKSACCAKKEAKKCGDSCTKSCCTKKEAKKCSDACTKSCCTKSDDSKARYQEAAEKVRKAIANNEITAEQGDQRLSRLAERNKKARN